MQHVVVGTAGHIDHGKTELVKALTGINPDRLKEEQQRGITIDIGFAPLPLGPDVTIGFVDVPGHERFVKNMLAGAWGIDVVLLVVAADESIKPQTREHFEICSLLQVPRGIVALTKIDLVDAEMRELVALEVRDFVRGSFLEGAPIVPVSARTGEGLELLKAELAAQAVPARSSGAASVMRLPVDRSFSIKGFGTVVTGTLVSGTLAEGDEVAVYPAGTPARVRGLQAHGRSVPRASAGQRTAVNLHGLDASSVRRGDVLARPGELAPSSLLDVKLRLLEGAPAALRDLARVRFHQGTIELMARVKLLGRARLEPGQETFAQLRLERPGCCLPADRFVIRRYSPPVTIGGGSVVDAHPRKHRGAAPGELLDALERLGTGDPEGSILVHLEAEPWGVSLAGLSLRSGRSPEEVARALETLAARGAAVRAGGAALASGAMETLSGRVRETLASYHAAHPLRAGMPREELRERALRGAPADVARLVIERLAAGGEVADRRDTLSLTSHAVRLSAAEESAMWKLEGLFRVEGLNPPSQEDLVRDHGFEPRLADKMIHLLLADGKLVRIRDGKIFHAAALDGLKRRLWELREQRPVIDIGSFKELTGTSRKNAIPLLEHLDAVKVTRRKGSDREILPPPGG
ncbi:MAG TPA: selenocysteine-specific translation elongation factor [Candidatus Polarisedimenticolia bacterium]|nr:selenocysteine-specific translation elongation factor [Candidatus Polarisedimenticolia bacterium]